MPMGLACRLSRTATTAAMNWQHSAKHITSIMIEKIRKARKPLSNSQIAPLPAAQVAT